MIVSKNKDYQFNDCNQDVGGSQNVQTLQVSADWGATVVVVTQVVTAREQIWVGTTQSLK